MEQFWEDWGWEIIVTLATIVGALILMAIIKRLLHRWVDRVEARYVASDDQEAREQGQRIVTLTAVVRIVARLTIWVAVILTIMATWGIPLTPLLAVGTTVGVAIGFGAQDVVKDVLGGFLILAEDQYSVGDIVKIGSLSDGVMGTVEEITLRTTILRDIEGNQHHVPNGEVRIASNLTAKFSRVMIDVPVAYDANVDDAIDVVSDEALAMFTNPDWSDAFLIEPEMLGVDRLDASSVNVRILLTTITEDRWRVKREFLRRIKNRLDAEGIEIPYQHITIVTKGAGAQSSD